MFNWKELAYAVNYASSALLVSAGLMAKTHEGTIGMIGQHYVRTGVLTKEDGALLARLQNMRHTGDYDDFLDWTQEDVEPCFPKVDAYIEKIKSIIYTPGQDAATALCRKMLIYNILQRQSVET